MPNPNDVMQARVQHLEAENAGLRVELAQAKRGLHVIRSAVDAAAVYEVSA